MFIHTLIGHGLNICLNLWGFKTVTSFYSKKTKNLISASDITLTFGTSSVIESLLSSKPTLEIGKTPRVCKFKQGYIFLSEDNMSPKRIKIQIEKLLKIKDKISIKLPSFCSVYYPEHKNVSVTGKYGKSMVSDLKINYLKNFF